MSVPTVRAAARCKTRLYVAAHGRAWASAHRTPSLSVSCYDAGEAAVGSAKARFRESTRWQTRPKSARLFGLEVDR
jgi:hypothetical protein